LPLAHHLLHSSLDNWSESLKPPRRNLRLFQQNQPRADILGQPRMLRIELEFCRRIGGWS
jgi:hypothetical protein